MCVCVCVCVMERKRKKEYLSGFHLIIETCDFFDSPPLPHRATSDENSELHGALEYENQAKALVCVCFEEAAFAVVGDDNGQLSNWAVLS